MKTYAELTREEQKRAEDLLYQEILEDVTSGALRFNDELNGDNLQAAIDAGIARAEAMRTPWFASEYIAEQRHVWDTGEGMDSESVEEFLRGMSLCTAQDALYSESGERVIDGIIQEEA